LRAAIASATSVPHEWPRTSGRSVPSRVSRAEELGLALGTPDDGARPAAVAEARTIETYDAKLFRRGVHQSADGEILQQCSIAVEHDQRRRSEIADDYEMQSNVIDIEELADRRIAPARDELERDVREYQRAERQKD
jgi:hypothetical protein